MKGNKKHVKNHTSLFEKHQIFIYNREQEEFLQKKMQYRRPGTNYVNISQESKSAGCSETVIW